MNVPNHCLWTLSAANHTEVTHTGDLTAPTQHHPPSHTLPEVVTADSFIYFKPFPARSCFSVVSHNLPLHTTANSMCCWCSFRCDTKEKKKERKKKKADFELILLCVYVMCVVYCTLLSLSACVDFCQRPPISE